MSKLRSRILLLAIVLITVLALGGYLLGWINPERLQALLLSAGIWAPLLYVVCYVLATAFLLPAFLYRDHQPLRLVGGTLERATGIEPATSSLGKYLKRALFSTYKIAQEKSTCMQRIPCMQCLICASLRDVCGTVFVRDFDYFSHLLSDRETAPSTLKTLHTATVKSWRLKVTVKPVEVNSDRALYGSKYPFPFGESIAKTDVNGKSKLVYEQPDSLSTGISTNDRT